MARETNETEAKLIDYLFRNGGVGTRQALVDYMDLVEGHASQSWVSHVLHKMAEDGLIQRWRGGQESTDWHASGETLYGVIDPYNGDDGL